MTPQSDEDEVWRQLVASFNESAEDTSADQPWPDRENVPQDPPRDAPHDEARDEAHSETRGGTRGAAHDETRGEALDEVHDKPGDESGASADGARLNPDDDHYIPPPPPPLPQMDAITKIAWLALFGGPAYLVLAALLSWSMEGWIVFAAVAAFIGGFVALVVRMGDGPPSDSGWDDGAVL